MPTVTWGSKKWGQFKWGEVLTGEEGVFFVVEKNKAANEGHMLLEITLDTTTLYLSDTYVTVTNFYEGLVLEWGDVEQLSPAVEGLASTGDATVRLLNKRMRFMDTSTYGDKFSDLFDDYDFEGRTAVIKQWFKGLTLAQSETIFTGKVTIDSFDREEVSLRLVHQTDYDLEVPYHFVDKVNYSAAPTNALGRPIPIIFGNWSPGAGTGAGVDNEDGPFAPAILTDRNDLRLDLAKGMETWSTKNATLGIGFFARRWVPELDTYMGINAPNGADYTDKDYSYVILGEGTNGNITKPPGLEGSVNTCTNWQNATKGVDDTSTASIDGDAANNILAIYFGSLPDLGRISEADVGDIRLQVTVDSITGGAGTAATIQYYNPGFDAGGPLSKYNTATNITGTGITQMQFAQDKAAHGVDATQQDQYTRWTWDELGSYEFVVTAQAGFQVEITRVVLNVRNITIHGLNIPVLPEITG